MENAELQAAVEQPQEEEAPAEPETQPEANAVETARPSRPQRQAAQLIPTRFQEDGQMEPAEADPAPVSFGNQGGDPDARVNLEKMKIQSLRKYAKMYDLSTVHPQSSKDELVVAVKRHWAGAHVSEDALVQNLMRLRTRGSTGY